MFSLSAIPFILLPLTIARPIDLDGNGIPDFCVPQDNGSTLCLDPNGKWIEPPSQDVVAPQTTSPQPTATTGTQNPTDSTAPLVALPTASSLPPLNPFGKTADFASAKGTKWDISYIGDIKYTGSLATKSVYGDKCRTSKIGSKVIWNCGDMSCNPNVDVCGFAMGPAFYGTDDVMTIDTDDVTSVQNNNFVEPWVGDAQPEAPQTSWGMDTSNVAPINDTHGVAFARQIWRGAPDGSYADQGNAVASITLGQTMPKATRVGPLLTGPDIAELGLVAILRDGEYIYVYSMAGPSKVAVSRVPASDDVFDRANYESLVYDPDSLYTMGTWHAGLPLKDTSSSASSPSSPNTNTASPIYGMTTLEPLYTIICNIFMSFTNMYLSDTPYGPWSTGYSLLSEVSGYGSHAHPEYSEEGGRTIYFSQGPNGQFQMYKVTFDGY
ncbi:uncharacterized protein AB675_11865 [Cyphellophora attinorum]|uniref:DUF4185 domain-containing protein n=1 Tax=Cyphellophora attinorum TaxID=1664694 RepID=A0A0N1NWL8_9EURO|nr:uncharacterized protein AB675_11865 [Phialophora attinorum]KPI36754.1 hypothetical protein AB675_11865 [Phialophora attinorum]